MTKFIIPLFLCLTALTACNKGTTQDKRMITVTIEPLRFITEKIAGDRFNVVTMVPNGGNPETFEPTTRQMIELSQSSIYVKVGEIGFERTWNDKLTANSPDITIVDSSEGIQLIKTSNGINDPHTWMSTTNVSVMAQNIYKTIVKAEPADSTYFKHNLEALLARIASVERHVRSNIGKKRVEGFLIYHPALTYFAHEYGLKQIPIEEEGREPGATQLKHTIMQAKQINVKTMFVQKEFANRNTDIVARESGAKKIEINPLSYHWDKEMIKISKELR